VGILIGTILAAAIATAVAVFLYVCGRSVPVGQQFFINHYGLGYSVAGGEADRQKRNSPLLPKRNC